MMELLPLERVFEREAKDKSKFPRLAGSYFDLYKGLLNFLRTDIYPHIDPGLSSNSELKGFYTAHNEEHFDEVIRYAGSLLGVKNGTETIRLEPYELFILLVAIRIHDAGNGSGREEHEKKCFSILRNCHAVGNDDTEKKIIAVIAQAHGGKSSSGDRDTIGDLPHQKGAGNISIRSRLIASIVRFADEICENRGRAANYLLEYGGLPKKSEIFHRYAAAIKANYLSEGRLMLEYEIKLDEISKTWDYVVDGQDTQAYLVDVVFDRLEKMDRERRYCNRYSRELYTIDAIRASVKIVDQNQDVVRQIPIPELSDTGYPDENKGYLKDKLKEHCGVALNEWLKQLNVGEIA